MGGYEREREEGGRQRGGGWGEGGEEGVRELEWMWARARARVAQCRRSYAPLKHFLMISSSKAPSSFSLSRASLVSSRVNLPAGKWEASGG